METKSWSEKVGVLSSAGLTYAEIAEATGSRVSTIGSLATGAAKSPRGDLALRLHTLYLQHAKSCGIEALSTTPTTSSEAA